MRVLDTATILAAMAQVSPRPRRAAPTGPAAPAAASSSGGRTRSCHRPAVRVERAPGERGEPGEPGSRGDGPRHPPRAALHVVPQGVIPVIVMSSRLAAASRAPAWSPPTAP